MSTVHHIKFTQSSCLGLYLMFVLLASASPKVMAEPEVEVMHWMARGGEQRAIRVIRDEFESRGGVWYDVPGSDSIKVLNAAVSRMAKGYSPSLVQWNSGWEVAQIKNLGLLNVLDERLNEQLSNIFIDDVLDIVRVNGKIVAVPLNVHSENWLWYRRGNDDYSLSTITEDWTVFLQHAIDQADQDKVVLAVGNEPWQQRILFNNVVLGTIGKSQFENLYSGLDSSVIDTPEFVNAVKIFSELKRYSRSFGEGLWNQQLAAVASGKAQFVSMGDWAKGEFRNLGLRLGRDYDCIPAPGTTEHIILEIDVFALGHVTDENEKRGQQLFIEVVTDQAVSETFNYLKGSLSPLVNVDLDVLDKCNQTAYQTLIKRGAAIKPHANVGDRGLLADIDHMISALWSGDVALNQWRKDFSSIFLEEWQERQGKSRLSQLPVASEINDGN